MRVVALVVVALLATGCGVRPEDERPEAIAEMEEARTAVLVAADDAGGKVADVLGVPEPKGSFAWVAWDEDLSVGGPHRCEAKVEVEFVLPEGTPVPVYGRLIAGQETTGDWEDIYVGGDGHVSARRGDDGLVIEWVEPLESRPGLVVLTVEKYVAVPQSVYEEDCDVTGAAS